MPAQHEGGEMASVEADSDSTKRTRILQVLRHPVDKRLEARRREFGVAVGGRQNDPIGFPLKKRVDDAAFRCDVNGRIQQIVDEKGESRSVSVNVEPGRHLGQKPKRRKIPQPLADALAEKMREVYFGVLQAYVLRFDVGGVGERLDEAAQAMDVLG